jgi:hypothetical protein
VPTGGKKFGSDQFKTILGSEAHNAEGRHKKNKSITIQEENGELKFGKVDMNTGVFQAMPIVRVGEKKDLFIESIHGEEVTLRMGTFTEHNFNKKTGVLKNASFK